MKSVVGLGLAIALAVGIASPVYAADLSLKAPPASAATPAWTGIYLGLHGGGAYADTNFYLPASATNVAGNCLALNSCPANFGSHTNAGGLFGGVAGINYQSGMWLVGAELEASWVGLKGGAPTVIPFLAAASVTGNSKIDSILDASARFGVVSGRSLFFVKGGAAFARSTYWTATPALTTATASDTRTGWIAGVGAEYAFHGPWSAKIEYDYVDLGTKRETFLGVGGSVDVDIRQTVQIVKAGVNYRFSGW